jgi:hypothetical protein
MVYGGVYNLIALNEIRNKLIKLAFQIRNKLIKLAFHAIL